MESKIKGYFTASEYGRRIRYGEFEYRGRTYFVRYAGWFAASDEEPWMQHKKEQERIDRIIEDESKPQKEYKPEDSAEYALDQFLNYVNS